MRMKREIKNKYKFYEEKGEFGGPRNESLCFKLGTPTMFGFINVYNFVITNYVTNKKLWCNRQKIELSK